MIFSAPRRVTLLMYLLSFCLRIFFLLIGAYDVTVPIQLSFRDDYGAAVH